MKKKQRGRAVMRYRKKPVVVDAVQLQPSQKSIREVLEFMGQEINTSTRVASDKFYEYCNIVIADGLKINTLEGVITASMGDYIIKGVQGEFYPCKPGIFNETYEKVEEE